MSGRGLPSKKTSGKGINIITSHNPEESGPNASFINSERGNELGVIKEGEQLITASSFKK